LLPNIIIRHVIWELTKFFLISSFAFVALMMVVGVVRKASDEGIGPEVLIQLIPYILPESFMFAMPATCLLSVCVVFGRLAADNELIAIQSMGLHKSVIVLPALAIAFLLSLFAVWVNDVSFAWSHWGIERVVLQSTDKIIYGKLKNEGSIQGKDNRYSIEVQGVEGRKLIRPIITYYDDDNKFIKMIAEEAELYIQPELHKLGVVLYRGSGTREGIFHFKFDATQEFAIPLKSPEDIAKSSGNPSHLYLRQINGEIEKQARDLEQLKQSHSIRACSQMITGDLVGLTNMAWKKRNTELRDAKFRLDRLHLVPHRRWANGFSCFAFAMIGIPVALKLKTANYATTFGICFLPILFIYYPLFMFGLNGAKMGTLPPYGAWIGNLACVSIGLVLMYREFRR
jgi:lipopolysaccharide export system permease protein